MEMCVATVSYRGWRGDELEEALKDAVSAGYRFVEVQYIPNNLFSKLIEEGPKGLKKLDEMVRNSGLTPVVVYCPPFGGPTENDARVRAKEIMKFIDGAKWLGCKVVVSTDGPRTEGGIERIVTTLKELEPKIEETGVNIGLEPHFNNRIEQISDYGQIFRAIPNDQIGICIDTGHFYLAKVNVPRLVAKYPDQIFHVHLKDHKGPASVPFGKGEVDNLGCLKVLKEIGYEGYLSVELEIKDKANTPKYVREARKNVEGLLRYL